MWVFFSIDDRVLQSEQSSAFKLDSTGFDLSSIESKPAISLYLESLVLVQWAIVKVCCCAAFGLARSIPLESSVTSGASLFAKLSNVPDSETSDSGKGVRA
jgi:hypothetical protein